MTFSLRMVLLAVIACGISLALPDARTAPTSPTQVELVVCKASNSHTLSLFHGNPSGCHQYLLPKTHFIHLERYQEVLAEAKLDVLAKHTSTPTYLIKFMYSPQNSREIPSRLS